MTSPAKAHFQRHAAAALAGHDRHPMDRSTASQYELMLAKLAEDRRRLKDIQSLERKAEVKRQLLPEYRPWLEGVLTGGSGRQDDILMTCLVWSIDIGDLPGAVGLAQYALTNKLTLPDQYKRTTGTLIAEEFAEQSLKALAADQPADLESLLSIASLTDTEDMPDEVRAKLEKAIGYAYRDINSHELALAHLKRALELFDRIGVKKDIERLEVVIKNSAGTQAAAQGDGQGAG